MKNKRIAALLLALLLAFLFCLSIFPISGQAGYIGGYTFGASDYTDSARFQDVITKGPWVDVRAYGSLSAADTAAVAAGKQLLISSTVSVTGNTTISSPLIILKGGSFSISSGVTLTLNSPTIEAGFYQIFSFADATAHALPGAGAQWSSTPVAHYIVKMDWFGAVPDAVIPASSSAMGTLPTGTDSASAIRRAVKYVNTGSPKFNQSTSSSQMILLGTPNGVYYVTGANLFGSQLTSGQTDSGFIFDGQGCAFLWNPTNTTDAFIDKLEQYWRPIFQNFNLLAVGFTGSKGVFAHVSDIAGGPTLAQPHFYNIGIEGGKTSDYVTGFVLNNSLTKIFHIEDTTNDDRFYVENSWFSQFDKFLDCSNPNSVSWNIFKSTITTNETNAVYFNFTADYGGGFRIEQSEILLAGNTQTIFKTSSYTGSSNGDFYFKNNRVESPGAGTIFTVVDATFGDFYIENANFEYGAGVSENSILSYLIHPARLVVKDSNVPGKIKIYTRGSADYLALSGRKDQLRTYNTTFTTSYPRFTFIKDTDLSEMTYRQVLEDGRAFRPILIRDSQPGSTYYNDIYYDGVSSQHGGGQEEFVASIHRVGSSYPYLDGSTANAYLPAYSIITSIKCFSSTAVASVINGIRINIGNWTDNMAISDTTLTVNEFVTGNEIGVSIPLGNDVQNKFSATYTINNVDASPEATPAYCVLKYRGMRGRFELPGSDVSTMIGTP